MTLKIKRLTSDILDDLNYQFMRRLQKEGLVTLKELFICTAQRIEANSKPLYFCYGAEASITIWQDFWTLSTSFFVKIIILFCQENDYGTKVTSRESSTDVC